MDYIVWYTDTGKSINSFETNTVLLRMLKNVEAINTIEYIAHNIFCSLVTEYDEGGDGTSLSLKDYVEKYRNSELEKFTVTAFDENGYPTGSVELKCYRELIKDELRILCAGEP